MSDAKRYCVAVKREARDTAPADWRDQVFAVEGVKAIGPKDGRILLLEATPEAIQAVREKVGGFCHVEDEIRHSHGVGGVFQARGV